jgi:formiminotetrahydrofolate cyclodeaminase|eukprot:evm.model.NODE_27169_length_92994_cov_27.080458.3
MEEDGLLLGEREKEARFAPLLMLLRDRHVKDEEEEGMERGRKAVVVDVRQAASTAAAAAAMAKCFMFKPPLR